MTKNKCTISGCERVVKCKSLCTKHYNRLRLHGSTDKPHNRVSVCDRFWSKVDKTSSPNGCWLWTDRPGPQGYGTFWDVKTLKAHRVAWAWSNMCPMPPSRLVVDHKCHELTCVNPDHLRLVTVRQNTENRKGANRGSKAGIRGVSWHKRIGKWAASVRADDKLYHLGYFTNKYEAGEVARQGRLKYHTHNDKDRK